MELAALAERVEEYGSTAYLVSVGESGHPHIVSLRVRFEDDRLLVSAGRTTLANAAAQRPVTLLWPAAPGGDYALIVDGVAQPAPDDPAGGPCVAISPTSAVLHRTPEGDSAAPSCVEVLAADAGN